MKRTGATCSLKAEIFKGIALRALRRMENSYCPCSKVLRNEKQTQLSEINLPAEMDTPTTPKANASDEQSTSTKSQADTQSRKVSETYSDPSADVESISSDNTAFWVHSYQLMAARYVAPRPGRSPFPRHTRFFFGDYL